jgi:hypothetical protein
VQWHRDQLTSARDAGIDILLPVYTGGDGAAYRTKGLLCLAQALKEMRAEGKQPFRRERGYPLIGMWLDLSVLRGTAGAGVDLKTEDGRRALYGAIQTFYRHVPAEFRAEVWPPAGSSGRQRIESLSAPMLPRSHIVVLTGAGALKQWDEAAVAYCSRRFAEEFRAGLTWLGGEDVRPMARGLDGYLSSSASPITAEGDASVWLTAAVVRPILRAGPPNAPAPGERLGGQALIQNIIAAMRAGPDWIVLDSWNGYQQGTDVAPSHEYGLQPRDLTRAGMTQFKGSGEFAGAILRAAIPAMIAPKTLYQIEAMVENTGLKVWGGQNRVGLSYRWFKDGRQIGDVGPLVAAPNLAPGESKSFMIALTSPMTGTRPAPEGRYELRLDLMAAPQQWFAGADSAPLSVFVEVGKPAGYRPTFLGTELPLLMRSGATYPGAVRVRNDGSETWRKGRGLTLGYRWRRVTSFGGAAGAESDEAVNAAMVQVPLPADVPPGAIIPLPVSVKAVDDQGVPLPPGKPEDRWSYDLEWDLFDGQKWLLATEASRFREAVAIVPTDPGVLLVGSGIGSDLVAGRTHVVKVGVRNIGPDTWKAAESRLGYHWYYFDGSEAAWSAGTAPLPKDVAPGEEVIVPDVSVTVPDYNGPMYLAFDLQLGGGYASTSPSSRGLDLLVVTTLISGGRMSPVDLSAHFDTDGISSDTNRADGDFDGAGATLPAESLPPYVLRPPTGAVALQTNLYPCGLWHRPVGTAPGREGQVKETVTFSYPEKRERGKNAMSCAGQRLELPSVALTALHLLGCGTAPDAAGSFTVVYKDGSTDRRPVTMSLWTAPPRHGEHVAFACPHRHTPQGDTASGGAYLNHYTIAVDGTKPVAALILPDNRAMKVLAVTLEWQEARPASPGATPRLRLPPALQPRSPG